MAESGERIDVAIVGGGIVGMSCALHLQTRGRRPVVIDPGSPTGRATFGNAGVISRSSILPMASPSVRKHLLAYALGRDVKIRLRWGSLPSYAHWLAHFLPATAERRWLAAADALDPLTAASYDAHLELAALAGAERLISRNGWLHLFRSEADFAGSARTRAVLAAHGIAMQELTAAELSEAEPSLAPRFARGLLFTQSGSVDSPGELLEAYRQAFVDRGGTILPTTAESMGQTSDGVAIRLADGRTLEADRAVLSAGIAAARLARSLGTRIPYAAERGYHVHVGLAGNAVLNRPVHDTGGGYNISPMGGAVRVLSGVELAKPDDPPDYRQIEAVVADARRTLPLAEGTVAPVWHGSRPSTPDGLPVIGVAPKHDRIVFAFGHGHIGLSTGPVTGRAVADLLTGVRPALPLEPFRASRFG